MLRFVVRRLLQVVPTLLLLSLLVFAWLRSLPGGPAAAFLGDRATPERIAEYNRLIGLDQPLYVQYGKFLARVATGDFGTSTKTSQPVLEEIGRALPATVELSIAALLIAVLLGIPLGYLAAQQRGRPLDVATIIGTLVGVAVPVFFLGYLLKAVFAVRAGLVPAVGAAGGEHRRHQRDRVRRAGRAADPGVGRQPGRAEPPRAARRRAGHHPAGGDRADHPRLGARRARLRLRAHRQLQGPDPRRDPHPARAAQRAAAGVHHDRAAGRACCWAGRC